MLQQLENDIKRIILALYKDIDKGLLEKLILELPPEKIENEFDISTNIALILSKAAKKNPMEIANEMVAEITKLDYVAACEVVRPAFINIKLKDNILFAMIEDICQNRDKNLVKNLGNGEKINVEFCSANPTGPLHIGHARGTIFGDTLASLLSKSGYDVCREYYINDAGGQMDKLEKSIQWRIDGAQGELPEGCYPGEYLQEIADKRKKELAKKLKIPESGIDLLLNGGVRSIRFQYNGYILTFPYAGGAIIGDEVDSYAIYELTPTASSVMDISYYGIFVIHKKECEDYDCKFIIDTYNY